MNNLFTYYQRKILLGRVQQQKKEYDYLAPDGSEIRLVMPDASPKGGLCHCLLPPKQTTVAVKHKTVDEAWYVIAGEGQIWFKNGDKEEINQIQKGSSISIPVGCSFQFRNTNPAEPLEIVIATMPPWPGADEAITVSGKWAPTITTPRPSL